MKHLTVDEMIGFVSLNSLDKESLELASKVNAHLLTCPECRKKIDSFQTVYDELLKINREKRLELTDEILFAEPEDIKKETQKNHFENLR